ncbi:hypothetical protein RvY_10227 [Ramazzottius varieornatus]|uniref:RING-type domain-containing protein n=1 Tax=Ramazzottius varieornatus TaxID=947166 RepID=A0A1D1VC24_RAMVA|nr:hypothetical protein RvY_10227 [Ramazzottius varieornatus]
MDVILRLPRDILRQYITCYLCDGVLIDATALPECSHEFCRSCIVKHCSRPGAAVCPVGDCGAEIHKTKPLAKIKNDTTLQTLVYKLFPHVYKDEMEKRRVFYQENPKSREFFNANLREATQEDLGVIQNVDWLPRPVHKTVFVSLQYLSVVSDSPKIPEGLQRKDELVKAQSCFRYCLQSDSAVGELKKLAALKFHLQPNHMVVFLLTNIILEDSYTLSDIIRFFSCKQPENLVFDFVLADVDSFSDDVSMEAAIVRAVRKRPVGITPSTPVTPPPPSEPQPSTSQVRDEWISVPSQSAVEDSQPARKRQRQKRILDLPFTNGRQINFNMTSGRQNPLAKRRKGKVTFEAPLPDSIDTDPLFEASKHTAAPVDGAHIEYGKPSRRRKRKIPMFVGLDPSPPKMVKKDVAALSITKAVEQLARNGEVLSDELVAPYESNLIKIEYVNVDPKFQQYLATCFKNIAQIDNDAVSEMRYLDYIRQSQSAVERQKSAVDMGRKTAVKRRKKPVASEEGVVKKRRVRKPKVVQDEGKNVNGSEAGEVKTESNTLELALNDHTYARTLPNESFDSVGAQVAIKSKKKSIKSLGFMKNGSPLVRPQNPVANMSMNVQYTNGASSNGQQQLYLVPASQPNNQPGNVYVLNMDQVPQFGTPGPSGNQNASLNGNALFSVPILSGQSFAAAPMTSPNGSFTKYGQQRSIAPRPTLVKLSPLSGGPGISIVNGSPLPTQYGKTKKKRDRKKSPAAAAAIQRILENAAKSMMKTSVSVPSESVSRDDSSNTTPRSPTPIPAPAAIASSNSTPAKEVSVSKDDSKQNVMWPTENNSIPTLKGYDSDEETDNLAKCANGLPEQHLTGEIAV